ncbi:MAG TPA: hypothetical protein VHJ39_04930 [Solirubrobacteraceae bacterium]|nr:hypothetical protein [Solirubrobacteraceae bacterium]
MRPDAEHRHPAAGPDDPRSTDSRRALLGRLIDHAALFPPASLDMPAALEADRQARDSPEAWMLDRFIVPASRLGELPEDTPRLSVVLDRGEGDLDVIAQHDVVLLEGRIDPEWIPETQALVDAKLGVPTFWELPPGRGLAGEVAAVQEAGAGAKIRCGGLTADAFPPVEAVAEFVLACRDAGVRFKATAGLHHPIRRVDPETGFHMHGFLNLLAAAVFAHQGADDVIPVLAEEDPTAFTVDAGGIAVHGWRADGEAIAAARAELFVAYGSCSFSEPVDDLTALGILPL